MKNYNTDGETVLMRCDYSDKNFVDKSVCKGFLTVDCGMCISTRRDNSGTISRTFHMCYNTDTTLLKDSAYKGQVQLADGDSMTNPRPLMLYTSTDAGTPEWGYVCIPQQFMINNTSLQTMAGTVCRQLGFTNYSVAQVTKGYGYS